MAKGAYYLISVIVSITVLILLGRFFGISWNDVMHFIRDGIGGGLYILKELRDSIVSNWP